MRKKISTIAVIAGFAAISIVAVAIPRLFAQSSSPSRESDAGLEGYASGILGSKHDFSDGGRIARDLCTPCHTPHLTAAEAPLLLSKTAAKQPVRPYQQREGELSAASLVCLSCHDGIVAHDVYAGPHAMTWSERLSAAGGGLTSHPLGIRYPSNDPNYHPLPAVTANGKLKLPDGRIQCTTCHDPHHTQRHPGMLVQSNERSRLCLACHRL